MHTSKLFLGVVVVGLAAGCGSEPKPKQSESAQTNTHTGAAVLSPASADPLAMVTVRQTGESRLDSEIRQEQERLRGRVSEDNLERLGWLFIAKARASFDAGYYKLAEQCAAAWAARQPEALGAQLLRGHALHSQHRFGEAETLARSLVRQRGLAFDFGLLGDVLVDEGRVDEAAQAYQSMLDLKPDPVGYARAGHIRWLKGDLTGAVEVLQMAARGSSPRDPETAAWIHTQLARYLWQAQATNEARRALEFALSFQSNYAPALLWRGRMLLSEGAAAEAIPLLRQALQNNPLPEYFWTLSEALRAAGQTKEAATVEDELDRRGAYSDPRTYALYLATRGQRAEVAITLAREELKTRMDVFTQDALAWALAADCRFEEARSCMTKALAEGTQDARLYLHAAVIAGATGKNEEARTWLSQATALMPMLLPGERIRLEAAAEHLGLKIRAMQLEGSSATTASRDFTPGRPEGSRGAPKTNQHSNQRKEPNHEKDTEPNPARAFSAAGRHDG